MIDNSPNPFYQIHVKLINEYFDTKKQNTDKRFHKKVPATTIDDGQNTHIKYTISVIIATIRRHTKLQRVGQNQIDEFISYCDNYYILFLFLCM